MILSKNILFLLVISCALGFGQNEQFSEVSSGVGKAPDGTRLAFRVYKKADGTGADIRYGTFSSPASAQIQLRNWLKSPNKTTGVEKRLDKSGKVLGERVIVSFKILGKT
jgi:hypothetical protein